MAAVWNKSCTQLRTAYLILMYDIYRWLGWHFHHCQYHEISIMISLLESQCCVHVPVLSETKAALKNCLPNLMCGLCTWLTWHLYLYQDHGIIIIANVMTSESLLTLSEIKSTASWLLLIHFWCMTYVDNWQCLHCHHHDINIMASLLASGICPIFPNIAGMSQDIYFCVLWFTISLLPNYPLTAYYVPYFFPCIYLLKYHIYIYCFLWQNRFRSCKHISNSYDHEIELMTLSLWTDLAFGVIWVVKWSLCSHHLTSLCVCMSVYHWTGQDFSVHLCNMTIYIKNFIKSWVYLQ